MSRSANALPGEVSSHVLTGQLGNHRLAQTLCVQPGQDLVGQSDEARPMVIVVPHRAVRQIQANSNMIGQSTVDHIEEKRPGILFGLIFGPDKRIVAQQRACLGQFTMKSYVRAFIHMA